MKLHNTLFLAFPLYILATFANYAQNDYGLPLQLGILSLVVIYCLYLSFTSFNRVKTIGWSTAIFNCLECFFLSTFLLGLIGRDNHWAGSGAAIVLSCLLVVLLNLIYFTPLFKSPEPFPKNKLVRATLLVLFLGVMFKIMHWPFGSNLILLSLILVILVSSYKFYRFWKVKEWFVPFGKNGEFHNGFQIVSPYLLLIALLIILSDVKIIPNRYRNELSTKLMTREVIESDLHFAEGAVSDSLLFPAINDYDRMVYNYQNAFE